MMRRTAPFLLLLALLAAAPVSRATVVTPSVTVTNAAPLATTLGLPADGAPQSTSPTLSGSFTDPEGDTGQVQFDLCRTSDCSTPPAIFTIMSPGGASGTTPAVTSVPLTPGVYFWRARGVDQYGGQGPFTAIRSFTADLAPVTPAKLAPVADVVVDTTPTLAASFEDPDPLDLGILEFEVCSDIACASILTRGQTTGQIPGSLGAYTFTTPFPTGSVLFWRVRGIDLLGMPSSYTTPRRMLVEGRVVLDDAGGSYVGSSGADTVEGGDGDDTIDGAGGDDTILGGGGEDAIDGGDGDDSVNGGNGDDDIDGEAGNDILVGGNGDDLIRGCIGNDRIFGNGGNDRLFGCAGTDRIDGGVGNDLVDGGAGNDVLIGFAGNDQVRGGVGNDVLDGGRGNDRLVGGRGTDRIVAGAGTDAVDSRETVARSRAHALATEILESLLPDSAPVLRRVRDVVRCGAGVDRVRADATDVVARDCEYLNGRRRKFR
ncbi:MAG: Hemolysin-type calcium-binding region [Thermoleophilia bacterium]|nr:Hemolysin-type calcium-binding region [Thermoleophilia bacterium]